MGSFSMTCSISGLGIVAGTPVRALLLTENPYGEGWDLRTPSIRAHYNDYGSIERVHPRDLPVAKLWLRGLREDLVELGAGDNQCHDVPTRKDMTFDELLGALREGRVLVRQDAEHFWRRPYKRFRSAEAEQRTSLVPSFQKVEQLLRADSALRAEFGDQVTGSGLFCGKFVVDEPRPRAVRVRWESPLTGDPGKKYVIEEETAREVAQLDKARHVVEQAGFVGCVIASTDCRQGSVELVIFAPPSPALFHAGPVWHAGKKETPDGKDATLRVALAMVREDVWRALCRFPQRDHVDLDCLNCGQQPYYHGKARECPNKSINNKPLKKHERGSRYAHGPVFPDHVAHRVVQRPYGEAVWYGLGAYKYGVHRAWDAIAEHFRKKTPAELRIIARNEARERKKRQQASKLSAADADKILNKLRSRVQSAELTGDALKARDETLAAWERREAEKERNPVFGDFLVDEHIIDEDDRYRPGVWTLRHSVPGVISVGNHLSMLLADRKPVSRALLDGIAELAAVTRALRQARLEWRPASSTGSQDPEWDLHLRHLRALARIAESEIADYNAADWRDADDPPLTCAPLTFEEVPDGI